MNNLFRHIEYLILRHDCIIVPGFGAFLTEHVPARINLEEGTIMPPSREVRFNQAVTSEDGLLANSYARKYDVPFDEARKMIVRDVAALKEEISSLKSVKIGNLGTVSLSEEGNYVFSPSFSSLFGEISICNKATTITRQHEVDSCEEIVEPISDIEPDNFESIDETVDSRHNSNYYQFRIRKTVSRIAVAFSIVAIVIIAVIFNPIPADDREQRASVVPMEVIVPAVRQVVKPSQEARATEEKPAPETEIKENIPSHYLIIATFGKLKAAQTFIDSYSGTPEGNRMFAVESRNVTRVAIASSSDRSELQKMLNSHDISAKFPNSWIWTK